MTLRRPCQFKLPIILALAFPLAACVAVVKVPIGPVAVPTRPWPVEAQCPLPARSAADQASVLALVNAERANAGLPALRAAPAVSAVAHAFACELAAKGTIGHIGIDGSQLRERLGRSGVTAVLVSENVAAGQRSPEKVVADWMASPHHRANILRADVTTMGLGQADAAMPVWVLDLTS